MKYGFTLVDTKGYTYRTVATSSIEAIEKVTLDSGLLHESDIVRIERGASISSISF